MRKSSRKMFLGNVELIYIFLCWLNVFLPEWHFFAKKKKSIWVKFFYLCNLFLRSFSAAASHITPAHSLERFFVNELNGNFLLREGSPMQHSVRNWHTFIFTFRASRKREKLKLKGIFYWHSWCFFKRKREKQKLLTQKNILSFALFILVEMEGLIQQQQ